MRTTFEVLRPLGLAGLVLGTACGDGFTLPPATIPIAEQQITVYALTNTPVLLPSAYSLLTLIEVRTDQSNDFDFAFEIGRRDELGVGTTADTVAVLTPRGWFGFVPDGGFLASTGVFEELLLAPEAGYEQQEPVVITAGSVYFVTSRRQSCNFGLAYPRYAKLKVEELDMAQRRAVIRLVIDPNCGYRGLGTGIPER